MNKNLALAVMAVLGGCSSDETDGRNASRLAELERTHQSGSSTTIERIDLRYDGSQLREVNAFTNGTPDGTTRVSYANSQINRIDFADKEGDRAFSALTWTDNLLTKERYEITGAFAQERAISYEQGTRNVREMNFVQTRPNAMAHNWLARYMYDAEGRVEKFMVIDASETQTTELRYAVDGALERSSTYRGSNHIETYDYRYLPDGRLDEITDTHNGRVGLTYNASNLITEIRITSGSSTDTLRYTYEDGNVAGMSFAPEFPMGGQFDLAGKSYTNLALMHLSPPTAGEIVHVENTGGGGSGSGSGSGSGDVCSSWDGDGSTCDNCLEAACCSEGAACAQGTSCYSFYQCGSACNGVSTCISSCQSQYPSGYSAYQAFYNCSQGSCSSSCQ